VAAQEPDLASEVPPSADDLFAAGPDTLVIDEGCTLDGRLVTDRRVLVRGDAVGAIESASTVRVAEGGSVQGDIRARSVVILGAVVGDVNGQREVQLCATGKLHGNVVTSCFELERGAFFEGHIRMLRPQDTGWRTLATAPAQGDDPGDPTTDAR
jgi:cytoskeletal protein CcmA (bactofilin family)